MKQLRLGNLVGSIGLALGIILSFDDLGGAQASSARNFKDPGKVDASGTATTEPSIDNKGAQQPANAPSPLPADAVVTGESYRVGIEDDLQISVWREPELSIQVVVRPDGMISMPLLNDVPVVGLTTKELQTLLTEKLKPYVTDPQVTIIVRGIRSRKVYLVGAAARPGSYTLNSATTVLQLLAEAGGLSPFAKSESVYIIRRVGEQQQRIPFKYKKAIAGKSSREDFILRPGDVVVVP